MIHSCHMHRFLLTLFLFAFATASARCEIRVPAYTAYIEPDPNGASVSENSGITSWKDNSNKVVWFGEIHTAGEIECEISMRLPKGQVSRLRLVVCGQTRDGEATGEDNGPVTMKFGSFRIPATGYQRFTLESLNAPGTPFGDIEALTLRGTAAEGAHFNLKPRRNAASVHLAYSVPSDRRIAAFYCEATGVETPVWTYIMVCGWNRGYLGMQVNSPTERRIIFSVWDGGNEGKDRAKVPMENRTVLLAKGDGVYTGDFGNEGTGGHSHLVFQWKTGEKQRFLVTAVPADATHTTYSGYYFHPDKRQWMLISSWKAPQTGGYLDGIYSFSENFGGSNGELQRKALYGNQWIMTSTNEWIEITATSFSHDDTGVADRLDRFMGVENDQFFLSNGGYIPGTMPFGKKFQRTPMGLLPVDVRELMSRLDSTTH